MNNSRLTQRVGNYSTFAVEFELSQTFPAKWNEWLGSIWLWAGGRQVGNLIETEMVSIALDSLAETADETGTRPSSLIPMQSPKEILEAVMWARYGEADDQMSILVGDEKRLYPFEVLPRSTGPFFDNWEAALVEHNNSERFIFRERKNEVCEVSWPIGTFRDVVSRTRLEFQSLTCCLLKVPN
jgi:hypothetical protein